MDASITSYIAFRYPNWMDYARHQCRVQGLEGWEMDLMNDIVVDLLKKPETKLMDLMSRVTKKIVNGRPTTELDKFVLAMIKMNARSKFASFRKNTVGHKIIGTGSIEGGEGGTMGTKGGHTGVPIVATFAELTAGADRPDESTYNKKHAGKLDRMHTRNIDKLIDAGYPDAVIATYRAYYIESKEMTKKEKTVIESITIFLTSKKITLCFK